MNGVYHNLKLIYAIASLPSSSAKLSSTSLQLQLQQQDPYQKDVVEILAACK